VVLLPLFVLCSNESTFLLHPSAKKLNDQYIVYAVVEEIRCFPTEDMCGGYPLDTHLDV
jgi:hypothetical protein